MKIEVYGNCCHTCRETYTAVKKAAEEIDKHIEVVQIGDIIEILQKGIISTPAVVIDGEIICQGKHLNCEDAKKIIKSNF